MDKLDGISPNSPELEQAVLSCLITDSSLYNEIPKIRPEIFYNRDNQYIFLAIKKIYNRGDGIDPLTVSHELEQSNKRIDLSEILTAYHPSSHFLQYYKELVELYQLKAIKNISSGLTFEGANFLLDELSRRIDVIRGYNVENMCKIADPILDDNFHPFTWGTESCDEFISPIFPTSYIILTGNTGAGKTTFIMDVAERNAKIGKKVLYLVLESSAQELKETRAAARAGITKLQIAKENISDRQRAVYKEYIEGVNSVENFTLASMEGAEPTPSNIIRKYQQSGADLLIVDNFDKITLSKTYDKDTAQANASNELLQYANSGHPIIIIHHMRKGTSGDKTVDELRGSGKIGHDSTCVVLVHRAETSEENTLKEKCCTNIKELKTRKFSPQIADVYFHKGSYYDEKAWDKLNNQAEIIRQISIADKWDKPVKEEDVKVIFQ